MSAVTDFEYVERVPRQRAAEHLVDIAYALAGGETLEPGTTASRSRSPSPTRVLMIRRSTSKDGRVEVAFELSWSSPDDVDPASRE